jgi:hypothetical protein
MVPLMLAIAGSISVARCLQPRSIYSARIHVGRSAAARAKHGGTRFDRLFIERLCFSFQLLRHLPDANRRSRSLYVTDEDGRLVGIILPFHEWSPSPSQRMPQRTSAKRPHTPIFARPLPGDCQ